MPGVRAKLALLIVAAFGSSWGLEVPAHGAPAVEVCAILPLSGAYASLGQFVQKQVDTAGVKVHLDSAGDPEQVAALVEKARELGCTVLLGGLGALESMALAQAAEGAEQPVVLLTHWEPLRRRYRFVVFAGASNRRKAQFLAHYLVEEASSTSAIVIGPDAQFARLWSRAFQDAFETAGGRIVDRATWQPHAPPKVVLEKLRPTIANAVKLARDQKLVLALTQRYRDALKTWSLIRILWEKSGKGSLPLPVVAGPPWWNEPSVVAGTLGGLDQAVFCDVARTLPSTSAWHSLASEVMEAANLAVAWAARLALLPGASPEGITVTGENGEELRVQNGRLEGRRLTMYRVGDKGMTPLESGRDSGEEGQRTNSH